MVDFYDLPESTLRDHHLLGLVYSTSKKESLKHHWKTQLLRNLAWSNELKAIGKSFSNKGVQGTLLKGFALFGDIYQDLGARFASDIDILLDSAHMEGAETALVELGFSELPSDPWMGNDFKKVYCKDCGHSTLTVELHERLFWSTRQDQLTYKKSSWIPDFNVLAPEMQLLHLCGHLGFQHNFLKLFWLADISHFLAKHRNSLDWAEFWRLASLYKLTRACKACLLLVGEDLRPIDLRDRLIQFLLSRSFLIAPKKYLFRYLVLKLLLKDEWQQNLHYFSGWIKNKLQSTNSK